MGNFVPVRVLDYYIDMQVGNRAYALVINSQIPYLRIECRSSINARNNPSCLRGESFVLGLSEGRNLCLVTIPVLNGLCVTRIAIL
ncbi:hypothetical protein A5638_09365 [Mycolicibacterium fortuitum]|nr:hypothetical protein A5638_09365 [Mycolicibacterium fortuitum]